LANNTTLNAGTGGDVIATDDIAGTKYQRVKLMDGTEDSTAVIPGDAANGLDVDVTRVSGTVTIAGAVTNAGTFATQDSQVLVDNAAFTDGTSKIFPVGLIFDEVAGTALTENDVAAPRIDSKRATIGVIEDATTRGQRAAVSAANALKVDGSAVTQPVSGTVTANAGTGPFPISDNAGSITVDAAAASFAVNDAQIAGTAYSVNSGTKDAGTQRVTLATDQVQLTNALKVDGSAVAQPVTDNAGSLTVDAPVGTPVFVRLSDGSAAIVTLPVSLAALPALVAGTAQIGTVSLTPGTTGGLTPFHLIAAGSTNATNLKASGGQVFGWFIRNFAATDRKVAFHNTAGTPTAGAGVIHTVNVPAGSAANVFSDIGITFATGIAITTVTDITDAGATAVTANDLDINIFFK
jgi:hypothetical protein